MFYSQRKKEGYSLSSLFKWYNLQSAWNELCLSYYAENVNFCKRNIFRTFSCTYIFPTIIMKKGENFDIFKCVKIFFFVPNQKAGVKCSH